MSTRRRKVLPGRLVFFCSNRITENLPEFEGWPLSQRVLDSRQELRDVQCITGQNGDFSVMSSQGWEKARMRLLQTGRVRLSRFSMARLAQQVSSRLSRTKIATGCTGMNLPKAAAFKAQQGEPPTLRSVKRGLNCHRRSHDGEVNNAIRHPSADSMLSWVTVPLQHPPFRHTLVLNGHGLPATP